MNDSSYIFIMGLHRSGTTFLYETLTNILPVCHISIYQTLYAGKIKENYLSGKENDLKKDINAYFRVNDVTTRLEDNIKLSADTVEEYGWALRRMGGSFRLIPQTRSYFEKMCSDVIEISKMDKIILKNPWDTGFSPEIQGIYPNAKFVFIKRDPIETINSQLHNLLIFAKPPTPLLDLLIKDLPAVRLFIKALELIHKTCGEKNYIRLMTSILKKKVKKEIFKYKRSLAGMKKGSFLELSYDQLTSNPQKTLTDIVQYLGYSPENFRVEISSFLPEKSTRKIREEVAVLKTYF